MKQSKFHIFSHTMISLLSILCFFFAHLIGRIDTVSWVMSYAYLLKNGLCIRYGVMVKCYLIKTLVV